MTFVRTPQGPIELCPPDPAQLRALRALLPLGAVQYDPPEGNAKYGIVMKCADKEAYAVKQQGPDLPAQYAGVCFNTNSLLIALSLRAYLEDGFAGLMMPCSYFRNKGAQEIEAGIAYFGAPDPAAKEAVSHDNAFDNEFGTGFTTMLTQSTRAIHKASVDSGIPLPTPIGFDVRPRSALETLGFGFLVHGKLIYCLKTAIAEKDPVWTALRSTGIENVVHMPSVPAEIPPEVMIIAKGY